MKIGLDENISIRLFRALRELWPGKDVDLRHVPTDFGTGHPDDALVKLFAADGGDVLVSGDGKMPNHPHRVQALLETRLLLVFVPNRWSRQKGFWKAAFLIRWWNTLVSDARGAIDGSERAWRIRAVWEGGRLEPVKLVPLSKRVQKAASRKTKR